ncbi:NlpC/P60 family protein (plasmid) [Thioclava sp. 'Guangxiensis']|uniref:NlpC/P60 family protein n=1 Tax=Thioclava sp. 'Guangxiensis' TaxID=3149044 RepID=UPI0032C3EE0C
MSWSNAYIGIPYAAFGRDLEGADCWGLACIVYACELGVDLPDYLGRYASVDEQSEISALIDGAASSPLWAQRIGPPRPFDIAVFRQGQFASHLGLVIRPGVMLHMVGDDRSKVERYSTGPWSRRLIGEFHWLGKETSDDQA